MTINEPINEEFGYFELINDWIFKINRDNEIIFSSPQLYAILGYKTEEVIGRVIFELLSDDERQRLAGFFRDSFEQQLPIHRLIVVFDHRMGYKVILEIDGQLSHSELGNSVDLKCIARDITKNLRLEEERNLYFNYSIDMLCMFDMATLNIEQVNPAWTKILGWNEYELEGFNLLEKIHVQDRDFTQGILENLASGKQVVNFENRYVCRDTSSRWLIWNAISLPQIGKAYAIARDATKFKKTEEQLEEKLKLLTLNNDITRAFLSSFPLVPILKECLSSFINHIPRTMGNIWLSREMSNELIPLDFLTLPTNPEESIAILTIDRELASGCYSKVKIQSFKPRTFSNKSKYYCHGFPFSIGLRCYGVLNLFMAEEISPELQKGIEPIIDQMTIGIIQKKNNEEVARSEKHFRSYFNSSLIGIGILEPKNMHWLEVNQTLCDITGYVQDEIMNIDWLSLIQKEDHGEIDRYYQLARSGKIDSFSLEIKLNHKSGNSVFAQIDVRCIRKSEEEFDFFVVLIQDISSRKKAEMVVHDQSEQLSSLLQSISDGFFALDNNHVIRFFNRAAENLLRLKAEDVLNRSFLEVFPMIHKTVFVENYKKAIADKVKVQFEAFIDVESFKDWYHVRIYPYDAGASVYFQVTTEQRRVLDELERTKTFLATAIEQSAAGMIVAESPNGIITMANQTALEIRGETRAILTGIPFSKHPDAWNAYKTNGLLYEIDEFPLYRALVDGETSNNVEILIKQDNGKVKWVLASATPIYSTENIISAAIMVINDITEYRKTQEQLLLSASVFENSIEGIAITDKEANIQDINPAFSHITGYGLTEVKGKNPRILKSDRHDKDFYQQMWSSILNSGSWAGEIWNRRKNGEAYPQWLSITSIKDSSNQISHFVALFHDISEKKEREEKLKFQAFHDALTGLPNRQLFNDRLRVALINLERQSGKKIALLSLDLDNFKHINDSFGHYFGDILLQQAADRLGKISRAQDTVARLGGDEFSIIMQNLDKNQAALKLSDRIIQAFADPFVVNDKELYVSVSIGLTFAPNDGNTIDTLVKNADIALYRAKSSGKNTYAAFTPQMNKEIQMRVTYESLLRKAIHNQEFRLLYQPKVNVKTGRISGMEALIRWERPGGEIISPLDFIPIAEETGLIFSIGEWVLDEACRVTRDWLKLSPDLSVAVNLSGRQFQDPGIPKLVENILANTHFPPANLNLEITENILMSDINTSINSMDLFSKMGIKISLDDFGTGYSSLSYLKKFPINILKIDKSFVSEIPNNHDDMTIARAIISLAKSLNLQLVAEGVETVEQFEFMKQYACEEIQGYLFSKPISAGEMKTLLEKNVTLDDVIKSK
ncbi:MAG: PAS domain S-box protein [Spirochaetales bacterium]|nr:PAS domain S-box protein [Spirochaetales bacterium]